MTTTQRRFGIEIEFIARPGMSREAMAQKLTDAGVPAYAAMYSDTRVVPGKWKVKPDGSLYGGNGMELVSPPISGQEGFDLVTKASVILLDNGAQVNKSCGLHVHVDAAGLDIQAMKKLAAIYIENERVIDSFLPPSRRGKHGGGGFAASITDANLGQLKAARTVDEIARVLGVSARAPRYVKLNFESYRKHGTVEFRHHSGTVDAAKINKWVSVCLRLIDVAVKEMNNPITAPSVRPRRSKSMALVFDMISRPEGASAEEMRVALNRQTKTSMGYWLKQYGVGYRVRRGRYYLEESGTLSSAPATLEDFLKRLEMGDDDKAYWVARAQLLGTVPSDETIATVR